MVLCKRKKHFHCIFKESLLIFLCGVHFVPVNCQSLSSDLPAEPVCPEQVVTFTCETRDSPILAWTSDEYIERGGTQLEFATFNAVNDTRISPVNSNTIATLITNFDENGVRVLRSTLRIIALSEFLNSSVNCLHIGDGTMSTSRVQVLADSSMPQDIRAIQTLDTAGNCILFATWRTPSNIMIGDVIGYLVYINGISRKNISNDDNATSILTTYSICHCSSHNVSVRAINRCNSIGVSTPNATVDSENIPNSTCNSTKGPENSPSHDSFISDSATIVFIVMTSTLVLIAIGITVIIKVCQRSKRKKKQISPLPANDSNKSKEGKSQHREEDKRSKKRKSQHPEEDKRQLTEEIDHDPTVML